MSGPVYTILVSLDPVCGPSYQLLKISGSVRNSKLQQFSSKE